MEPIDYLRLLRRRWMLLVACVVVAASAAWITGSGQSNAPPEYEAEHTIIRDQRDAETPAALATVSLYMKTGEVPRRVDDRLDFPGSPARLAQFVKVEFDDRTATLTATAVGATRAEAARRVNAFAEETIALLGEQATDARQETMESLADRIARLQVDIDALDAELDATLDEDPDADSALLETRRDSKIRQYGALLDQQQAVLDLPPPSAGYATLQEATPELAHLRDDGGLDAPRSRPVRAGLGALFGLLLGFGVVLVVERVDPRLNTRPATEEAFALPVVAEIPYEPALSNRPYAIRTLGDPASAVAEGYRSLRAWLLLMPRQVLSEGVSTRPPSPDDPRVDPTREPHVILVTSPGPGDGKSSTVANLAVAFAETGRSVLVLGCDFRRPRIHAFFGVRPTPGISHLIEGEGSLQRLAQVARPTRVHRVAIAPHGSGLSNIGDFAVAGPLLVAEARTLADVVLIDCTPLLSATEVLELVPAADAVVVVCRSGRTTAEAAARTHEVLARLGAHVVGIAMIRSSTAESTYYYAAEPPKRRRWPWGRRAEPGERQSRRNKRADKKAKKSTHARQQPPPARSPQPGARRRRRGVRHS